MKNNQASKAVTYCQSAGRDVAVSLDRIRGQQERCDAFAQEKRYTVVGEFVDASYTNEADRPGIADMLAFLREHRKDKLRVLVTEPSRLGRDSDAFADIAIKIQAAGASIEFTTPQLRETEMLRDVRRDVEREHEL